MKINFICPTCGFKYQKYETFAGKTVKCSNCGINFHIPLLKKDDPPIDINPDKFAENNNINPKKSKKNKIILGSLIFVSILIFTIIISFVIDYQKNNEFKKILKEKLNTNMEYSLSFLSVDENKYDFTFFEIFNTFDNIIEKKLNLIEDLRNIKIKKNDELIKQLIKFIDKEIALIRLKRSCYYDQSKLRTSLELLQKEISTFPTSDYGFFSQSIRISSAESNIVTDATKVYKDAKSYEKDYQEILVLESKIDSLTTSEKIKYNKVFKGLEKQNIQFVEDQISMAEKVIKGLLLLK